jgi:L-asparaginase II
MITNPAPGAENPGAENPGAENPVLAEVVRSGFVESRHRGAAAGLAAGGDIAEQSGDIDTPVFPRSSNKPLQAVAMVRCGLDLTGELLSLAAASHAGEDFHVDGVRKILSSAGLTEDDLRCPASLPLDETTAQRVLAAGEGKTRIRMNCSGKHAAMLATSVRNGWPTASYLDPAHPLQVRIKESVAELAGEPVAATGIDGCGAPLFAISLHGLARAFRTLVLADPGSPEREVADAMRAYPAWMSGTTRDDRRLMDAVPGTLCKGGAEGVQAFALPVPGGAIAGAIKIDDGAARASFPVAVALLRSLGAVVPGDVGTVPVTGGDAVVGEVRPLRPAPAMTGPRYDRPPL